MSSDTLSEVLRAVRLTGAVFFAVDASAPWVAEAPPAAALGPHVFPGVDHLIEFHVLASGTCWGAAVGDAPRRLEPGDVIVFPHGDAHVLSSAPGMRGAPDPEPFHRAQVGRLPITVHMHGGGAERTEVICGFLGCDARPFNPLLAALPRTIHLKHREMDNGLIDPFVKFALQESSAPRPGGDCVLARLSELLFVEVVRRHLAALPSDHRGWLAGLRDDAIGRALAKIHHRPAHDWSLEELAREIGVSRSVLAERFMQFVGVPPMQYLADWRMQLASNFLATTSMGLSEIAERVGYGSEAALSRAYKRRVGVAPADFRKRKRTEGPPDLASA